MSSTPTSYPCPFCGAAAAAATGCPSCGRGPDADAMEVIRLDAEIARLNQHLQAARAQVRAVEATLSDTVTRRNAAAFRVGSAVRAAVSPPAAPPRSPAVQQPGRPGPAGIEPSGPAESRLTTLTVQNVLFALGGMLLLVAAAVFTAVAWAQVGVGGRAALLGAATAAVLAVPPFAARRGLTAAAETLAAVGLLMILLDGYAAWAVGFLGVREAAPEAYASAVCAITAATALAYSRLVRLSGPRISALLVAQPVLPLLALAGDTGATVWSLALTGVTVLDVAVLRVRGDRFRFAGTGIVAYLCGAVAAAGAGLAATIGLIFAGTVSEGAAAAGALVLIAAVLLGAAVVAGHRAAQAVTGGLFVVAAGVAAGGWALVLGSGTPELRLAAVALILAAPVVVVRPRLPDRVATGPWIGALLVAAVPALAIAAHTMAAAIAAAGAARPPLEAPLTATVAGSSWDVPVAAVAVTVAYAVLAPARRRPDLALIGVTAVGLLAPAAFGLPWWTAPVLALLTGAAALALATRARTEIPLTFRSATAGALGLHAVVTGAGHAGVEAAVCAAVTAIGIGAALATRAGPRRADVGAGGLVVGLLAVPPAVWLALLALDVSATGRVRGLLGVAILLWAVAHASVRRLPEYGVPALVVAVLVVAALPPVALAGRDPVSLYAATALVLLASGAHATRPGTRAAASGAVAAAPAGAGGTPPADARPAGAGPEAGPSAGTGPATGAPADAGPPPPVGFGPEVGGAPPNLSAIPATGAVVPILTLLAVTGFDLARVFLEPYGALPEFWSGTVPATSSVAWSTVVALLISAAAVWLTGRTRGALPATAPVLATVVPLALAAAGAPWPATPIAGLVSGLTGLVALALLPARVSARIPTPAPAPGLATSPVPAPAAHPTSEASASPTRATPRRTLAGLIFGALALAGLAGTTPVRGAMTAALALVVVASAVTGVAGRVEAARIAGWVSGSVSVAVLAGTAASAAGLGARDAAFAVLAAAAATAALEWLLAVRRPREAVAVAAVAHSGALVALLVSGTAGRAAVVCVLWATVLAVRALRGDHRVGYPIAAAASVLVGWWLLLTSWEVGTVETYTGPAAALALGAGWVARRGRPELPSWTAYGPALAAGFLPTFAVLGNSAGGDPQYVRRLLLGVAGLVVLVLGARVRLQAPVVVGAGVLGLVALHELFQFWDLVPRWVPLALGGILLVGIATTMEQRRRDLLRLRAAVSRMG